MVRMERKLAELGKAYAPITGEHVFAGFLSCARPYTMSKNTRMSNSFPFPERLYQFGCIWREFEKPEQHDFRKYRDSPHGTGTREPGSTGLMEQLGSHWGSMLFLSFCYASLVQEALILMVTTWLLHLQTSYSCSRFLVGPMGGLMRGIPRIPAKRETAEPRLHLSR